MNISIVIPVFNDQEVLFELSERLYPVLNDLDMDHEIIFVDDHSSDDSLNILLRIKETMKHVRILKLLKNSGQLKAIRAGLDHCIGDLIIIMDSDLQDRPEDIPVLIEMMHKNNADMAVANWILEGKRNFRGLLSTIFFTVSNLITGLKISPNLGVFRVMKKEILDLIKEFPRNHISELGYLYKINVNYVPVDLKRDQRFAGESGYSIFKLFKLAFSRLAINPVFNFLTKSKNDDHPGYIIEKVYLD